LFIWYTVFQNLGADDEQDIQVEDAEAALKHDDGSDEAPLTINEPPLVERVEADADQPPQLPPVVVPPATTGKNLRFTYGSISHDKKRTRFNSPYSHK
jgi:hypothetical protein